MAELFRDTVVGKMLRLMSGGKLYPFAEERDPSIFQRYIHHDKTQEMASYGRLLEDHEKQNPEGGNTGSEKEINKPNNDAPKPNSTSHETSRTRVSQEGNRTEQFTRKENAIGHKIDPEKGRDTNIVEWYGPDDSEVCHMFNLLLFVEHNVKRGETYDFNRTP